MQFHALEFSGSLHVVVLVHSNKTEICGVVRCGLVHLYELHELL